MALVTRMDQFMFAAVTSANVGQKLKKNTKTRYAQANTLLTIPKTPGIFHGPQVARTMPSAVVEGAPMSNDSLAEIIPPVQRRYSRRDDVKRYEEKRPAIATEMTPLKAVVDPMLMSARRQAMKLVVATAYTGIEVLSLT